MSKKIIITIDGFTSCGKSTLARQLAAQLNYIFIDSGAMYRAITLYFFRNNINLEDKQAIKNALANIELHFEYNPATGNSDIFMNDENAETYIREMFISQKVSEVSAIGEVRKFAVAQQRKIGEHKGLVMDGRDIGTTVFPHAELKFFMAADTAVRVERRYKELFRKNPSISLDEVKKNIEMRDYIDSNRVISPLRKADDAIVLDNSNLSTEQQLKIALKWVKEKMK